MSTVHFRFDDVLDILSRTPKTLRDMLANLPSEWIHCNEGENTWSPFDVIGHLIHGEKTDWMIRVQTILNHGETKVFEAFDRTAHLKENSGKSLETLLGEFESSRSENLERLKILIKPETDLKRTGKHPDFGTVTLQELLSTWVVHDYNHIGQIVRVMAKYYQTEVGPWRAYLGILQPK